MNGDQIILFTILGLVFGGLIWGRWRYDLVAFSALVAALVAGVVPSGEAFSGFGHPATVIIALVLVVSRGLSNSGVIELLVTRIVDAGRSLGAHIGIMASVAAALSAVMNNVAALALLMPVDMQAAKSAGRSPGLSLMPLSFASILGGMVTLIGTPPNIVIATYREGVQGAPFTMFDFAPVGLACAVAGILFVALGGWRLIPVSGGRDGGEKALFDLQDYIAELRVPENAMAVGTRIADYDDLADETGTQFLGLIRDDDRIMGSVRRRVIRAGDLLVVQGGPDAFERVVGALGLEYLETPPAASHIEDEDRVLMEVVVPEGAAIVGRTASRSQLLRRGGVQLLGISRQGKRFRARVRRLTIRAGDILLLLGPGEMLPEVTRRLGTLPLATRGLQLIQRDKAGLAVAIFGLAILAASFGIVYLATALAAVAVLYVALGIVPLRELYDGVEWPVIVLLGSMIPIGAALEASGGTTLIAEGILALAADAAPWVVLTLLMVVTMTLSDVMNNTATAVIAAPIGVEIANRLGVSADPFLMTVAVAASCAFLTPIGHKNNTLILGPGGYRFGDYWRMGLPLEILIIAVAVPTILVVWPF